METSTAVIISQIPLGIACVFAAIELRRIRKTIGDISKELDRRYRSH